MIAVVMVWFVRTVIKDRQEMIKAQTQMMDNFATKTQSGFEKVADKMEGMTRAIVASTTTTQNMQETVNDLRDGLAQVRMDLARAHVNGNGKRKVGTVK